MAWDEEKHPRVPGGKHGGEWFHGTTDVHAPGAVIDPAKPHRANFDPEHSDSKSVYIAGSVKHALHYAERDKGGLGEPHVYQVEPTGEHWPIAPGSNQHQTKSPIRIVREINLATEAIRHHQHALYALRSRELREAAGLVWEQDAPGQFEVSHRCAVPEAQTQVPIERHVSSGQPGVQAQPSGSSHSSR